MSPRAKENVQKNIPTKEELCENETLLKVKNLEKFCNKIKRKLKFFVEQSIQLNFK